MTHHSPTFDWIIIGAGPAGIATVGQLLDSGISPHSIGWMDPYFTVGDFGKKWGNVPSNTKVDLFLRFFRACRSFQFPEKKFAIEKLKKEENCLLSVAAEPLQWITDKLKEEVHGIQDMAMALNLSHGRWEVRTKKGSFFAKNVVLAVGSDPKILSHTAHETIPLETALDRKKLAHALKKEDVVGVFGASHSAILALAFTLETPVKQVINFYRSPHRYAIYLDDWILFDDTGLKGFTALWARKHIDGTPPKQLTRVLCSDHGFEKALAQCNKLIFATGFERRTLPVLEQYAHLRYDDKTGIIAPNLFGVGIAFPQGKFNRLGHLEHRVGLWKFMEYLQSVLPIWLRCANG